MAYKDEYEVARLYSNGAFEAKIREQFEGDYRIKYHLAPPILAKRDPQSGHLQKQEYGPWMLRGFAVLAKLRFLRGTSLDPFGKTEERRKEVALISEYEQTIEEILQNLSAANHSLAVEIAQVPEHIRGYGHVKERHMQAAAAEYLNLLERFRNGDNEVKAAQ
nr:DUF6537 domain-containing protein [Sneathiella glossodoripedis]